MLGDIVHNESVVSDLEKEGVKVVEKLDQIPKQTCSFQSSWYRKEVWKKLKIKK